ncbi:MAG: zinc ribbon domain-containing protein [Isosphaeraceae bacterium]
MIRDRNPNVPPLKTEHHDQVRQVLRVVGPTLAGLGLLLAIVGFVSFFSSFASFGDGDFGPPRYFWCVFLGMPLVFVGVALSFAGYGASVQRYMSGEMAPVARDTFNYLAQGTTPGVREMAGAVGEGLADGLHGGPECPICHALVPGDSNYCPGCGAPQQEEPCDHCGGPVLPGAKFCHQCGAGVRQRELG